MKRRTIVVRIAAGLIVTLGFVAALEVVIRATYWVRNAAVSEVALPYVVGHGYGPVPPWADAFRIIEPDEELVWKSRPNIRQKYVDIFSPADREEDRLSVIRQFIPSLPAAFRGNPTWHIRLNSEGFRNAEFPREKSPSRFRIVCLGDSWTFGANVGQDETYPQRLKAMLDQHVPSRQVEVLNLGVLGYASYNGLQLMRARALDLAPDLVVIAFAMNESGMAGYERTRTSKPKAPMLARLLQHLESYKLLGYLGQRLRHTPKPMAARFKEEAKSVRFKDKVEPGATLDEWVEESLRDYERYHREMIRLARERGASAILLYNELWRTSPYLAVLRKISETEGVPLVDGSGLVAEARRKIEDDLERRLDLRPTDPGRGTDGGEVEVVFRLYVGDRPVPRAMYLVGDHPALGDLVPNKIAMHDDGTHGDQRAGDHVWSYAPRVPAGTRLLYMYTNSGPEGRWEGLDVPDFRRVKVGPKGLAGPVYRPIDSFGEVYLQADAWHTNAAGYELIARAVLERIRVDERFRQYVARIGATRS